MPLPYYSRKPRLTNSPIPGILLTLPDIKKTIGHITKKSPILLQHPHIESLVHSYLFAENVVYHDKKRKEGIEIWKKTIEVYFELIKLGAGLDKYKEMSDIYLTAMDHLIEGQQDLYHCNEEIESVKNKDAEVRFKALMAKYHSLYEKNIRYSITLAIYCLDLVSKHTDLKKSAIKYCEDDLSYKLEKIQSCKNYKFINDLSFLTKGINPLVKNAISHKRIIYGEESNVIFTDRDKTQMQEFSLNEFAKLVEAIQINFVAQAASLTLFVYDYQDKLDFSEIKQFKDLKQLRVLIDEIIQESYFIPKDICFLDNKKIICDVEKIGGFDHPSELMGNISGVRFCQERPALKADQQALKIVSYIACLETEFQECEINVYDWQQKCGSVRVNLSEWTKIVKTSQPKEEFNKHIIENTLTQK